MADDDAGKQGFVVNGRTVLALLAFVGGGAVTGGGVSIATAGAPAEGWKDLGAQVLSIERQTGEILRKIDVFEEQGTRLRSDIEDVEAALDTLQDRVHEIELQLARAR